MRKLFASIIAISIMFAMPLCGQAETITNQPEAVVSTVIASPTEAYDFDKIRYVKPEEGLHLRKKPSVKSKSLRVLKQNKKLKCSKYNDKWTIVKIGKQIGYVKTEYLSKKKIKIPKAKYSAKYFRRAGVIRWNGWKWTWYSQRVLPGGGLKIPGRHVDSHGYICDKHNYICLASSTLKKGTVISTPFGKKGKVYDCGCAKGVVDVYVDRLH